MLKQIIALIALSVTIILFMSYTQYMVELLIHTHDWISQLLTDVFSVGHAGNLARALIALLSVPIFVGLLPTIAYWTVKRSWFPYFMEVVWIVWLIQAGALMVLLKTAAG